MGIPGRPGPEALERLEARDRAVRVSGRTSTSRASAVSWQARATRASGCELGSPEDAVALWDAILDRGVEPCGLGARDTLRLEVCYPLHGNDISAERTPIEAGWACALEKDFTGVDVLRRQKEAGPAEKLAAFVMEDPGISSSRAAKSRPERLAHARRRHRLGYVQADLAQPDTDITIDLRGGLVGPVSSGSRSTSERSPSGRRRELP